MFHIFPERYDEILDVTALPDTDRTEMNYRTKPLTDSQELRLVILMLLLTVPLAIFVSSCFR
ncbi:MAG: hypothetical protein AAF497_04415, partial [Planctomycetota bacterium]